MTLVFIFSGRFDDVNDVKRRRWRRQLQQRGAHLRDRQVRKSEEGRKKSESDSRPLGQLLLLPGQGQEQDPDNLLQLQRRGHRGSLRGQLRIRAHSTDQGKDALL